MRSIREDFSELIDGAVRLTAADVFARLRDVASEDEVAVLTALQERAGFMWPCPSCAWSNPAALDACEWCTAPRPRSA